MKKEIKSERIIGMEAYKKDLLRWLDFQTRHEIKVNAKEMSDVYIGKLNAYHEIIEHIEDNLRK